MELLKGAAPLPQWAWLQHSQQMCPQHLALLEQDASIFPDRKATFNIIKYIMVTFLWYYKSQNMHLFLAHRIVK